MQKEKNINSFQFFNNYTVQSKTINNDETVLKDRKTGELVLMKETFIQYSDQLKKMIQTLEQQKYLKNNNILSLINYQVKGNYLQDQGKAFYQLITLYQYSTRSMLQELQSRIVNNQCFEEKQVWSILCSLVIGLAYLQRQNIGHGCISLTDIFLSQDGCVRIVDPSLASYSPFTLNEGYYYSPQMIEKFNIDDYHYNQSEIDIFKSDIFSLGMCLLHCCLLETCEDCYDYDNCEIIPQILRQKFNLLVNYYSKDLLNTIYEMLCFDVNKRPNFIRMEKYVNQFCLSSPQRKNRIRKNFFIAPSQQDEEDHISNQRQIIEKDFQNVDISQQLKNERQNIIKECLKQTAKSFQIDEQLGNQQLKEVKYSIKTQQMLCNQVLNKQQIKNKNNESQLSIKEIKEKQFRIKDFEKKTFQNLVSVQSRNEEDQPKQLLYGKQNKFYSNTLLLVSRQQKSYVQQQFKREELPSYIVKNNVKSAQINNLNASKKEGKIQNISNSEQIYTDPALLQMMKHDIAKIMEKRKNK